MFRFSGADRFFKRKGGKSSISFTSNRPKLTSDTVLSESGFMDDHLYLSTICCISLIMIIEEREKEWEGIGMLTILVG